MISMFDNTESASRAAADLFVLQSREAVHKRGQFQVALSGGHTPKRMYELLAQHPRPEQTPWQETQVFWGDERCVAINDERNNARMVQKILLDRVPVDVASVHPIQCAGDAKAEAVRYDALLRKHLTDAAPALDLVFLGLGQNGHTASLFPYSPVLKETERWAAEIYIDEQGMSRVTMTPIIINAARLVVFLVFGRDKAQILKTVLEGPIDSMRLPAQLIRPVNGRIIWMVDQDAASLLLERTLQRNID